MVISGKCGNTQKSEMAPQIQRDDLLRKLVRAQGNGMVKIITGIRRSGKSHLLFRLFAEHLRREGIDEAHLIMLALDDRRNRAYRNPDALLDYLEARIPAEGHTFVLLDEVQMVDEFADVLNTLLHNEHLDIYVTGSNSRFLSRDIATSFRGRGDAIHVSPLSFAEMMQVYPGTPEQGLSDYLTYGGLPQVVLFPEREDKIKYLNTIFANTYLTDIKERYRIGADDDLEELVNIIASGIGGLTNPTRLENTFCSVKKSKISAATIKKYLTILEEAFLIEKATRYDIRGKRYIDTPAKYYFSDLGLRNARLNFRQFEETHLMENLIYNELRRRGIAVDVGVYPIHTRNERGVSERKQLEVDFVCNLGSSRAYIQSAYRLPTPEKREQELRSLRSVNDAFAKILITADSAPRHYDDHGILHLPLLDFLLHPAALPL